IYAGLAGMGETVVGAPQLLRELSSGVPVDRVALLRVHFEWACIGSAFDKGPPDHYVESHCDEGSTCIAGTCRLWDVDVNGLPAYDRTKLFDGKCFDTVSCLSQGSDAAL